MDSLHFSTSQEHSTALSQGVCPFGRHNTLPCQYLHLQNLEASKDETVDTNTDK